MSGNGRHASRTIDSPIGPHIEDVSSTACDAPSIGDLNAITTLALTRRLIERPVADGFARTLMRAYRASLTHRHTTDEAPLHLRYAPVHYPPERLRLVLVRLDAAIHGTDYMRGIPAERVLAELIALTTPPAAATPIRTPEPRHRPPVRPAPRVLNKHTHGMPAGSVWCGPGSYWANPFPIGPRASRDDVCNRFSREVLPTLDLAALAGRDLVCLCAPRRCHCDDLIAAANRSS